MTIRIGRGRGGKGVYLPSNTGMGSRANRQLEAHAHAQASKFREALKVDGPMFAFWRKTQGSIPCSCSAVRDPGHLHAHVEPGEKNQTNASASGEVVNNNRRRLKYVGDTTDTPGYYGDNKSVEESKLDKVTNRNKKKFLEAGDFPDEDDILDAFDGPGDDLANGQSLMDFDDPFNLFGGKLIECPICFGEGYQNAWQLHNGLRVVLDTSNAYAFEGKGVSIDNSRIGPSVIEVHPGGQIYWTWKPPMHFDEVIRVLVYNGIDVIDNDLYSLEYVTEDNSMSGVLDADALMELIGTDTTLTVVFKNLSDQQLDITHAEVVLNFAPFEHCQIPDIEMAYEQQFLDWNVETNIEIPAGMDVKEGDYLCEDKYDRVWKINSINRRITAGNTEWGTTLSVRVLHSFEKLFGVLEIF